MAVLQFVNRVYCLLEWAIGARAPARVCVWVCERERERERVHVFVCVGPVGMRRGLGGAGVDFCKTLFLFITYFKWCLWCRMGCFFSGLMLICWILLTELHLELSLCYWLFVQRTESKSG